MKPAAKPQDADIEADLPPEIVNLIKRLARQAAREYLTVAAAAADHAKVPARK